MLVPGIWKKLYSIIYYVASMSVRVHLPALVQRIVKLEITVELGPELGPGRAEGP